VQSRRKFAYPEPDPRDHEIVTTLKRIQFDLTNLQMKVRETLRMAGSLELEPHKQQLCPECQQAGVTFDLRTATKLAEHRYHSHDGPLPDHYAAAEQAAAIDHSDPGDETA
jgi:hypothetical protein